MKKLRILTKSLLFLSFFLPFFVLPRCDGSARLNQYIKDSLTRDSIIKDSLYQVGKLQQYLDSINKTDSIKKEKSLVIALNRNDDSIQNRPDSALLVIAQAGYNTAPKVERKTIPNHLADFCDFLIHPKKETISGFGVAVAFASVPFDQKESFELGYLLFFIFPLSFLITLGTLIASFFRISFKRQFYLSIVSIACIIVFAFQLEWKELLWGFYLVLFFNLLDITVLYLSIRKEKYANKS